MSCSVILYLVSCDHVVFLLVFYGIVFLFFVFFFSSRRRHTRSYGDLEFRRVLFRSGVTTVLCPADSAPEAALIEPLRVHPVGSLVECVSWLRGGDLPRAAPASPDPEPDHSADLEIGRASCRERA